MHVPYLKTVAIFHSFTEDEGMTSLGIIEVHILHRYTQLISIFASLEATDSTSSLPYPSVCYSFFLEFTKVAKEMKLMALTEGISIHQYIDGWLMRTNSKQQCQENTYWLGHLVESLGWITNFQKSDLFPTPVIEFLVTIRPQGRASLLNSK